MSELDRIIEDVKETFDGNAWHGPSIKQILSKIPQEQAHARVANGHSIIELVLHMAAWRTFVIHKLRGNDAFEVKEENNFPKGVDWTTALDELDKSQRDLLDALTHFDAERLANQVPNRKYSYYKLLHGIVQHDVYHQGQIVMITRQFQS